MGLPSDGCERSQVRHSWSRRYRQRCQKSTIYLDSAKELHHRARCLEEERAIKPTQTGRIALDKVLPCDCCQFPVAGIRYFHSEIRTDKINDKAAPALASTM